MSETNSGSAKYTSIGASSLTYPPNGRDHPECDKDVSPFLFMWFFKYFIICIQFHILNIGASPLTGPPTRQDHPECDKDVSPFFVVGNKNLCFDKRPRYRLVTGPIVVEGSKNSTWAPQSFAGLSSEWHKLSEWLSSSCPVAIFFLVGHLAGYS